MWCDGDDGGGGDGDGDGGGDDDGDGGGDNDGGDSSGGAVWYVTVVVVVIVVVMMVYLIHWSRVAVSRCRLSTGGRVVCWREMWVWEGE